MTKTKTVADPWQFPWGQHVDETPEMALAVERLEAHAAHHDHERDCHIDPD